MANVLTQNPWRLDTASTSAVLATIKIRVKRILWEGPTSGDVLILKDQNGKTMLTAKAIAEDYQVYNVAECAGQEWDGLIAYQIPHGEVELTYE